ncbi:MAG: hypothetical protein DBY35_04330 [Bacteroidales bacterium]|nr:MAG: hypothetical protein DBY35_04330 [Bacteroidales bacterium]
MESYSSSSFFDGIADTWDANETLSIPGRINRFLDIVCVFPGESVLDLGTGTGVLLPFLSERVGVEGHVTGVDFSKNMLDRAKEKFGDIENVQFMFCDFEARFPDGRFDLVMMYCVYPHLNDPKTLLQTIVSDHLTDIGRIVVAFPCKEDFVNNIHGEMKVESDMLPPAPVLAQRIRGWGMDARVMEYSDDLYILEIR